MEKENIGSLLIKSFTGKANPEEKRIIRRWFSESPGNKKEFEAYKKLWDDSKSLMLSDTIDQEAALLKTKKRIPQFGNKMRRLFFARQAAAVLLISTVLSVTINYFLNHHPDTTKDIVYQEIKAAFGTQTRLTLADGTDVWLNSGSTLRFPLSFGHMENRRVDLTGEGYFEVTQNAGQPFIVHTPQFQVRVLGTSFNVNAYEDEKHVEVALIEGKVELLQQVKGKEVPVMTLQPSEVADYDTENNRIALKTERDIDRYTAWRDGKIVFFDDPVEKLVSRLENWYNVDIEIADSSLMAYHFTATFSQESLDQVLKYLSISTPLNYKFIAPLKADNQTEQRKKIVLFGK